MGKPILNFICPLVLVSICALIPLAASCGSDSGDNGDNKNRKSTSDREKGLRELLGGDVGEENWAARGAGDSINSASDLTCGTFDDNCRWHNVDGADALEWSRGTGRPAQSALRSLTSTSVVPVSPYGVAFPDESRPDDQAWLVSDPVSCQQGDGELSFTYWTSVNSDVQICTRSSGGSSIGSCSNVITTGDPGPAFVNIPSSSSPFEMVVNGEKFETADDFVLLDDLEYNAILC